jgi:multidrug efflux system membrane fusion protein
VTRTYTVKVAIEDADDQLRWGMSANVGFLSSMPGSTRAIVLPMTALTQTDDKSGAKPAVWVVGADGRVKLIQVEVGTYAEQGVVVTAGLVGGETVVTAGVHKLQPGQQVRPLEDKAALPAPDAVAQADESARRPANN